MIADEDVNEVNEIMNGCARADEQRFGDGRSLGAQTVVSGRVDGGTVPRDCSHKQGKVPERTLR